LCVCIFRLSRGRVAGHFVACGKPEESLKAGVAEWGDPCRMPGPPWGKPLPANGTGRVVGE